MTGMFALIVEYLSRLVELRFQAFTLQLCQSTSLTLDISNSLYVYIYFVLN